MLAVVVVPGAAAQAGLPYLPLLGPPPLRIQVIRSPVAAVTKPLAVATPSRATNAPALAGNTNLPALSQTVATPAPLMPVASPSGNDAAPPVFELPTPELLGITPQMLATYFRPVQGTNAFVATTFPISFMPPLPPEKSSHAEYNVK